MSLLTFNNLLREHPTMGLTALKNGLDSGVPLISMGIPLEVLTAWISNGSQEEPDLVTHISECLLSNLEDASLWISALKDSGVERVPVGSFNDYYVNSHFFLQETDNLILKQWLTAGVLDFSEIIKNDWSSMKFVKAVISHQESFPDADLVYILRLVGEDKSGHGPLTRVWAALGASLQENNPRRAQEILASYREKSAYFTSILDLGGAIADSLEFESEASLDMNVDSFFTWIRPVLQEEIRAAGSIPQEWIMALLECKQWEILKDLSEVPFSWQPRQRLIPGSAWSVSDMDLDDLEEEQWGLVLEWTKQQLWPVLVSDDREKMWPHHRKIVWPAVQSCNLGDFLITLDHFAKNGGLEVAAFKNSRGSEGWVPGLSHFINAEGWDSKEQHQDLSCLWGLSARLESKEVLVQSYLESILLNKSHPAPLSPPIKRKRM